MLFKYNIIIIWEERLLRATYVVNRMVLIEARFGIIVLVPSRKKKKKKKTEEEEQAKAAPPPPHSSSRRSILHRGAPPLFMEGRPHPLVGHSLGCTCRSWDCPRHNWEIPAYLYHPFHLSSTFPAYLYQPWQRVLQTFWGMKWWNSPFTFWRYRGSRLY